MPDWYHLPHKTWDSVVGHHWVTISNWQTFLAASFWLFKQRCNNINNGWVNFLAVTVSGEPLVVNVAPEWAKIIFFNGSGDSEDIIVLVSIYHWGPLQQSQQAGCSSPPAPWVQAAGRSSHWDHQPVWPSSASSVWPAGRAQPGSLINMKRIITCDLASITQSLNYFVRVTHCMLSQTSQAYVNLRRHLSGSNFVKQI